MEGKRAKTFRELTFKRFGKAFVEIDAALHEAGIDFYMVGSFERDYRFYQIHVKPPLDKNEADFFIVLPDIENIDALEQSLKQRGFEFNDIYSLIYHEESDVQIRIYSFDEDIIDDSYVDFVDELCLTYSGTLSEGILEFITWRVPAQMGIFILLLNSMSKPIAESDVQEMENLLKSYAEGTADGEPEMNSDLYDFAYKDMSAGYARLLARDLHTLLQDHPAVVQKIKDMAKALLGRTGGLNYSKENENSMEGIDDDDYNEDYAGEEEEDYTEIGREIIWQFIQGLDEWSEIEMPGETEEFPPGIDTDFDEQDYLDIPAPRHFTGNEEVDAAIFLQNSAAKLYWIEQQALRLALAVLEGQQLQIEYVLRPGDTLYDSIARCSRDGVTVQLSADENDEGLAMFVILSSEINGYPHRIEIYMRDDEPPFRMMPRRLVKAFRNSFREESNVEFRVEEGQGKTPALSFAEIQEALEKSAEEYVARLSDKNRGTETVAWYEPLERFSYSYFIHASNIRIAVGYLNNESEEFYINMDGNRQKDDFAIEFSLRPSSPVIPLVPQSVMTTILKCYEDKAGEGIDFIV